MHHSLPSARRRFLAGLKTGMPIMLSAAPFAVLFGTLAIENGMTRGEAIFMSVAVYAGASQMVGIDLFGQNVAPWLIILSIFAVNFRMILYSAAAGPRLRHWSTPKKAIGFFLLVDQQFAEVEQRASRGFPIDFAWYVGAGLPCYVGWVSGTIAGVFFGELVTDPEAFGLDYLLPIYFLSMVMAFRGRALWLPVLSISALASMVAVATVGSPWHVSIGAVAGVLAGAILVRPDRGGQ
jgi:predicted branched-subunit amino acid permease